MTADQLPPKPDCRTGVPRPPHAPGLVNTKPAAKDRERAGDTIPAPSPPPEQGPVLAWYQHNQRHAITTAAVVFVLCIVFATVFEGLKYGDRLHWMGAWWMWLLVLVIPVWLYTTRRLWERCSAGVEWLQGSHRWVRTYELVKIRLVPLPVGRWLLWLKDRRHRHLLIAVDTLWQDQLLWDLVYNGMMHSIVGWEADVNAPVHNILKIPYPDR